MLHVDDLMNLILYQMDHLDDLNGSTFNVGGGLGVSASLHELTALCSEVTNHTIEIHQSAEDRPADIRLYITDHARVTAATGWRPQRNVRSILEDISAWIYDNYEPLKPILGF
jgi:CDP-paratose 2-epimerase